MRLKIVGLEPVNSPLIIRSAVVTLRGVLTSDRFRGLPSHLAKPQHVEAALRRTLAAAGDHARLLQQREIETLGMELGLRGQDVATLRRAIEQNPELVEEYQRSTEIGVSFLNRLEAWNEAAQNSARLTSVNQLRHIEIEPGVHALRIFRHDLPEPLQKAYDDLGVQYIFHAVDRRLSAEGGTGLCAFYVGISPVWNEVVGREVVEGGARSVDYRDPNERTRVPDAGPRRNALLDNMWLSYGMLLKIATAGVDLSKPEADWETNILCEGGGKFVDFERPTDVDTPQKMEARDLLKGKFLTAISQWEIAFVSAEDRNNPIARMHTMNRTTRNLTGGPLRPYGGLVPNPYTARCLFESQKAVMVSGNWDDLRSFEGKTVFLQGWGGVGAEYLKLLLDAEAPYKPQRVIVIEPDARKLPQFGDRTKQQYLEEVVKPEAAGKGVELVVVPVLPTEAELRGLNPAQAEQLASAKIVAETRNVLVGRHGKVNVFVPAALGAVVTQEVAQMAHEVGFYIFGIANNMCVSDEVARLAGFRMIPDSAVNEGGVAACNTVIDNLSDARLAELLFTNTPQKIVGLFEIAKRRGSNNLWDAYMYAAKILIERRQVADRERRYKDLADVRVTDLTVRRIVVAGGSAFQGLRPGDAERGHYVPLFSARRIGALFEVTWNGRRGVIAGRIDDLPPELLQHTLVPDAFHHAHVRVRDRELARRIIEAHPAEMLRRFKPVHEVPIDWANVPFDLNPSNAMFFARAPRGANWDAVVPDVDANIYPFGEFAINPAAVIFHYGQGGWEGMKAYRTVKGDIVGFRSPENASRFQRTMRRLASTPVSVEFYLRAFAATVMANEELIAPPGHRAALYVRPFQFGIGPKLGVTIASEEAFAIFVSPVGPYYKKGFLPIDLRVPEDVHRAGPGGTGNVKAEGNYIIGMVSQLMTKEMGLNENLYLDAVHKRYVEELGSGNFFVVKGDVIITPDLTSGTILPGITRDSTIQLAHAFGYKVEVRQLPIEEVLRADEAFVTGNAAVISPVGSITYREWKATYRSVDEGSITVKLYKALVAIQECRWDDPSLEGIDPAFLDRVKKEWIYVIQKAA